MTQRRLVPGTGLPLGLFGLLVAFSVAVFLAWDGWLWRASREASHVGRFLVSYLVVIPLAGLLLLAVRRWSWNHLLGAVGAAWGFKLVVTSLLYYAAARGTAVRLDPVRPTPQLDRATDAPAAASGYLAAAGSFAYGEITGRVHSGGQAAGGVLIELVSPSPGRHAKVPAPAVLTISGSHYEPALVAQLVSGRLLVHNRDPVLHTVHLGPDPGARALWNRPLPPISTLDERMPTQPGRYRLYCDNHPNERAWVSVVDHPYVTASGTDGRFRLAQVPAGTHTVMVLAAATDGLRELRRTITVAAHRETLLDLDLADASLHHTRAPSNSPHGVADRARSRDTAQGTRHERTLANCLGMPPWRLRG